LLPIKEKGRIGGLSRNGSRTTSRNARAKTGKISRRRPMLGRRVLFGTSEKPKGFVNKKAPIQAWKDQDKKEHMRCGIVFYYPNIWDALGRKNGMPGSSSGGLLYDGDTHLAFERPLAMSPWCTPEPSEDWEKNKSEMIVFHNYWADLDTCMKDRYLFIE
jgi:hypothetical protein